MSISKEEIWEILKELGADDPCMHAKEIEYAIEYVNSKKEMKALEEMITWEAGDIHYGTTEAVEELAKQEE